ncbi:MAG: MCE family protein, partial [Proteobacteria bacterium]
MKQKTDQDLKTGLFVTMGLALSMIAILVLGGSENAFTKKVVYKSHVPNATGLLNGAKVVLSGLNVGNVRGIEYDGANRSIELTFAVEKKYAAQIRSGSTVEIMTQGVLGDKYLALTPGAGDGEIAENSEIPAIASQDISQMISKSDQLLA